MKKSEPSRFIKRYIDDYATVQEIDPKSGKPVTRRVYTGDLYKADMSDKKWKGFRWITAGGVILCNALIIAGAVITAPSNIIGALVIPEALGLFGILFSLYLTGLLLLARYPYTSYYHFRCTSSIPHTFLFNAVCFGICAIEALICAIVFRDQYLVAQLQVAGSMALGTAGYAILWSAIRNVSWYTADEKQ